MKKISIYVILFAFIMNALPVQAFAMERLYYYFANEKGLTSYKKNHKEVDVFAPQTYTVGYDLKVKELTRTDTKALREAKRKKSDVMPLIVNADFNQSLMTTLLNNTSAQEDIIDFMLEEAKRNKYIGWQFDFENLNHRDRDAYVAFAKKTYEALKKEGLLFSIAVIPRGRDYDPNDSYQDWSSPYDYKRLAQHSDFLTLMTYDDPNSLGPVASILYVRYILDYMITQVPPEKISLGIPLYCWKWTGGVKTRSTTYDITMEEYREGTRRSKGYDAVLGNEWFKWYNTETKKEYTVWCDGAKGAQKKLDLIEEYKLRGFSAWAIGQENKAFWRVVD